VRLGKKIRPRRTVQREVVLVSREKVGIAAEPRVERKKRVGSRLTHTIKGIAFVLDTQSEKLTLPVKKTTQEKRKAASWEKRNSKQNACGKGGNGKRRISKGATMK